MPIADSFLLYIKNSGWTKNLISYIAQMKSKKIEIKLIFPFALVFLAMPDVDPLRPP